MKKFHIVSKFKYVVLYANRLNKSFNQAILFNDEFDSFESALKCIKSEASHSKSEDEKYYIAMIQDDTLYPMMYIYRISNNLYLNAI